MLRNTVMNAVEMVAYDTTKQFVGRNTSWNPEQKSLYLLYGFVAGFVGQMCGNPIDIIKT